MALLVLPSGGFWLSSVLGPQLQRATGWLREFAILLDVAGFWCALFSWLGLAIALLMSIAAALTGRVSLVSGLVILALLGAGLAGQVYLFGHLHF